MAFVAEILLAAAADARSRGDLRAARACLRNVLEADPHNAEALAGIAALDASEAFALETTVSAMPEPSAPVPLLEGDDLEELSLEPTVRLPERPPRALTYARASPSAAPPPPVDAQAVTAFPEPFVPPRPHLAAAGRRPPSRGWSLVAVLACLALLIVTRAL